MNKNCKQCGTEFVPTNDNRGHEQLYCSKKCGQISARIRREERLKNSNNDTTIEKGNKIQYPDTTTTTGRMQNSNLEEWGMDSTGIRGRYSTIGDMATIEKLYESKIENNYLKLKCENLEEKVKALQLEVNELTMDIEAMEIDEEIEQPNNGFLGSIFEQFKADPISTVAMVKMMFQNLTDKKESNEQTQTNKTNTAQQGKS